MDNIKVIEMIENEIEVMAITAKTSNLYSSLRGSYPAVKLSLVLFLREHEDEFTKEEQDKVDSIKLNLSLLYSMIYGIGADSIQTLSLKDDQIAEQFPGFIFITDEEKEETRKFEESMHERMQKINELVSYFNTRDESYGEISVEYPKDDKEKEIVEACKYFNKKLTELFRFYMEFMINDMKFRINANDVAAKYHDYFRKLEQFSKQINE